MTAKIRTEPPMAFFKGLVDEAIAHQRLDSSEDSAFYLVQLLSSFVHPDGAYADVGTRPRHPLGVMLLSATRIEDSYRRFVTLRTVGDLSLFLSGFFAESLERRPVDSRYFVTLGETAYGSAADACRMASATIFEELAAKFVLFAHVLTEVAAECSLADDDTVEQIFERLVSEERVSDESASEGSLTLH